MERCDGNNLAPPQSAMTLFRRQLVPARVDESVCGLPLTQLADSSICLSNRKCRFERLLPVRVAIRRIGHSGSRSFCLSFYFHCAPEPAGPDRVVPCITSNRAPLMHCCSNLCPCESLRWRLRNLGHCLPTLIRSARSRSVFKRIVNSSHHRWAWEPLGGVMRKMGWRLPARIQRSF